MDMNSYQSAAGDTAIYPGRGSDSIGLWYTTLGLVGEAGEIANKVKKIVRDDAMILTKDAKRELAVELGDVLWYVSELAVNLGFNLNEIALMNLEKLAARKVADKIKGSGDNR